jgi:hypothetical protein
MTNLEISKMEWAPKPSSVYRPKAADSHLSGPAVAYRLALRQQPTRVSNVSGRYSTLFGLAGGGVYRAESVTKLAVRSYRTISPLPVTGRYVFCGTFPRIAPGGR